MTEPTSQTSVSINAVYVVQSLGGNDEETGQSLYTDVIYPNAGKIPGLYTEFIRANTEDEFVAAFSHIARSVLREGRRPIIHLEAHGTDDGLCLADGATFTWKELVPMFGHINQSCRMNLVVVAIACHGWRLARTLTVSTQAPFFMSLGPPEEMLGLDLLDAARLFYLTLFDRHDLSSAIDATNAGRPSHRRLQPETAEIVFCKLFRSFAEDSGLQDNPANVAAVLEAEMLKDQSIKDDEKAVIRAQIAADVSSLRVFMNF